MKTHILAPHGRHSVCGLQWMQMGDLSKGRFVGENAATCNLCRRGRQGQRRKEMSLENPLKKEFERLAQKHPELVVEAILLRPDLLEVILDLIVTRVP